MISMEEQVINLINRAQQDLEIVKTKISVCARASEVARLDGLQLALDSIDLIQITLNKIWEKLDEEVTGEAFDDEDISIF